MSASRRLSASVLAASVGFAGCNLVFSLDDYAGTKTGDCASCSGSSCECAPKALDGFEYARLLRSPKPQTVCPPGLVQGQALGSGHRDTGCACTCQSPTAGSPCGLTVYTQTACGGSVAGTLAPGAGCAALPAAGLSARIESASGTCTPGATLNPPEFDVPFMACLDAQPASDSACASGSLCTTRASAPFDPALCLMAKSSSSKACPSGFSHGYTFATGFDDLRSCDQTGCSCRPQACSATSVSLCVDAACGSCPTTAIDGCFKFGGFHSGKVDSAGTTTGTCEPQGQATTSGTLENSGTILVCCREALAVGP